MREARLTKGKIEAVGRTNSSGGIEQHFRTDAAAILQDMEEGLNTAAKRKFISITDRREAIKTAINLSQPSDIVLVAGKGHEKYQEIKGVKYPFDDKTVLREIFELLGK